MTLPAIVWHFEAKIQISFSWSEAAKTLLQLSRMSFHSEDTMKRNDNEYFITTNIIMVRK
jgi:hypothetical protein